MVWNFNYWKRLGVKGPRPRVLFGNFPNQFSRKKHMAYDLRNIYEYVVTVRRLTVFFSFPTHSTFLLIYLRRLDLIKIERTLWEYIVVVDHN